MSLRRQQLRLALDGDKTMLIWLGKVLLGQKESMQLDANVRREEVVQHHVISNPTDLAQFVEALREAGVWERIAGWNGEDAERESVH